MGFVPNFGKNIKNLNFQRKLLHFLSRADLSPWLLRPDSAQGRSVHTPDYITNRSISSRGAILNDAKLAKILFKIFFTWYILIKFWFCFYNSVHVRAPSTSRWNMGIEFDDISMDKMHIFEHSTSGVQCELMLLQQSNFVKCYFVKFKCHTGQKVYFVRILLKKWSFFWLVWLFLKFDKMIFLAGITFKIWQNNIWKHKQLT